MPNQLAKPWFRKWHPWRWEVDKVVLETALGTFEGSVLLDVACNDGWYGQQAARAGASVVGVDGRAEAIQRAELIREYFEIPNIKFVVGNVEDTGVLTGKYDATLFYGILYHLADPIGVLERIGQITDRIVALQTFIHALDRRPTLHLLRESPDLPGKGLTQLVTTPTQRAIVMMLQEAGFHHVYRSMPTRYLPAEIGNSDGRWQWAFFYGVKGEPLATSKWLVEIKESDRPLNHFGAISRTKGRLESLARVWLNKDTLGGFSG